VAVALAAFDAPALTLGEARVRSSLGDPLDVRIPVTLAPGEAIEPGCFSLVREATADMPRVTGARISVERSAAGTQLRVETRTPVNEPALVVGIAASCGGAAAVKRDYSLLLDPPAAGRAPPSQAPAPATARAQPPATALRDIAATLVARIGDTLESIAHAIFPRNRSARRTYVEALRDANPNLATLGENDPIPVDTPVALPDLRTFAKGRSSATHVAKREAARRNAAARAASKGGRILAAPGASRAAARGRAGAQGRSPAVTEARPAGERGPWRRVRAAPVLAGSGPHAQPCHGRSQARPAA
jgi:pilus assembly protein FimV